MSVEQGQKRKRGRPAGSLVSLRSDPDRLAIVFMHAMSTHPALHAAMTILDGNGTLQHNDTIARQAWLWCELRDLCERHSKEPEIVDLEITDCEEPSNSEKFPYLIFDRREQKTVSTGNRRKKGTFDKPDTRIKKLTEKYARSWKRDEDRSFIEEHSEPLAVLIGLCCQKVPTGFPILTRVAIMECGQHLVADGFDIIQLRTLLDCIRRQRNRALRALKKPEPK